ncbi:P-loop containing nucleoside triphosphate hydrolase protein [Pelagophyceae sp. CCMP2097]|nr:P-loop containing nucleoside triphosphate hydrolase protein [Pelagophyceae sp. CCMP2097]
MSLDAPLLELQEDGRGARNAPRARALEWQRISCFVANEAKHAKAKAPELRCVLDDVSGGVCAGSMLALMGPSGSGKTTLLNVVAGRPQLGPRGEFRGGVLVDGAAPDANWTRELGYVMQKDVFFQTLTVREELWIACALRLPPGRDSKKQRFERFSQLVEDLGLEAALDTKVGSATERGLSGGELKRVNIAVELVADPPFLLCDEPLTGLDSYRAFSVLKLLRDRATKGRRAVALSIHQPSSKLYELFDDLCLLAPGGHKILHASKFDAEKVFSDFGRPVPPHWTPPDHFIEVLQDPATDRAALLLVAAKYDTTAFPSDASGPSPVAQRRGFWRQLPVLVRRGFLNARGTYLKPLEWSLAVALASTWGCLWFGVARGGAQREKHAGDIVSVVFFVAAQFAWGPAFSILGAFPAERDVLTKERASDVYSIEAWFASRLVVELPISAVFPTVFLAILFPLVGLPVQAIPAVYAVTCLQAWVSAGLGMAMSAALFDRDNTATVVIVVMVFQMCAGGFFLDIEAQPSYVRWVRFTSYWYYALGLYCKTALVPYDHNDHHALRKAVEAYSFSTLPAYADALVLVAYGVAARIVAFVCLKCSRKIKFS